MGWGLRKSFKIGKHTRINLSRTGGIGFSTGVKGARISVNKRGARATVGAKGVQYRKDISFKDKKNNSLANSNINTPNLQEPPVGILGLIGAIFQLIGSLIQLGIYLTILGVFIYIVFKIF